jgi:predicted oxidoreductase (fatty acid repression mutant protein)
MINCIEQESLEIRRSIYALGKTPMVADHCLIDTISACVKHCPTAFNVQSARVAILFDKFHTNFWKMVWLNLKEVTPDERIESAKSKIDSFIDAYGTILFFEDKNALKKLKKQYPLYKKNMHDWVMQANGMLQYMVWQTLAENEEGASLQHYNELIKKQVNIMFDLPRNWEIVAQMPWGSIEKTPYQKTFLPIEDRVKIFK